jgi:hypothetical protein
MYYAWKDESCIEENLKREEPAGIPRHREHYNIKIHLKHV